MVTFYTGAEMAPSLNPSDFFLLPKDDCSVDWLSQEKVGPNDPENVDSERIASDHTVSSVNLLSSSNYVTRYAKMIP